MTQDAKEPKSTALTAAQVADYLLAEPEFFNQHLELLENINVADPNNGSVSLTIRQLALLRDKNEKLQMQLDGLLDIARENDALFGRMQSLTAALIDARCVEDVFAVLDDTLRDCFGADFFAIRLVNDYEDESFPIGEVVWKTGAPEVEQFEELFESQKIKCGHPTHTQAEALFGDQAEKVLSTALIPLKVANKNGILAIGSKDANRFHPSMGGLFLSHLGVLVAKRLESLQGFNDVVGAD
ncbi:MAG: hypothetical protein A6F71_08295 [Cycloclasticus sp. symbiont of Poecilosclerida sp. M]|nr:MAG: hypothetical protein A6F71_08295 [Cycloclasticus sp. symbiont of Poecilosclerida sp. M]